MQTTESRAQTRGFGVFELDLRAAELRKRGVRIKLQEQPFQILCLLLEHSGQLVARDELRQKLWPAHTFVDFDRSLNKAMAKLRSALGDSAETPRYIETIPRHGYRLLVPVEHSQPQEVPSHFERFGQQVVHDSAEDLELPSAATGFPSVAKPARLFYSVTEGWSFSFLMAVTVTLIVVSGL